MKSKRKHLPRQKQQKKFRMSFVKWFILLGVLLLLACAGFFIYKQYSTKGKLVLAAKTATNSKSSNYPWPCKNPGDASDKGRALPCDASEIPGAKLLVINNEPIEADKTVINNPSYPSGACTRYNNATYTYTVSPSSTGDLKRNLHPWLYEWYSSVDCVLGPVDTCDLGHGTMVVAVGSGLYRLYLACLPVLKHPTCITPSDSNHTVTRYCTYSSTLPKNASFTSSYTCSYPNEKCVQQQCPAAQKCPTNTTRLGAVPNGHCGVTICRVTNPPKPTPSRPSNQSFFDKVHQVMPY